MKDSKYIIRSVARDSFFVAIHGFTPFFGPKEKARKFDTFDKANEYALSQLFTTSTAFEVETI